jgi:phosphatidylglycerophosphatase A
LVRFKTLKGIEKVQILCATLLFVGYFPFFPGTVGTLATLPLYLLLSVWLPSILYLCALVLTIFLGIWSANFAERHYGSKDPKPVVVDEMSGFLLTMLFIEPSIVNIALGFFIFRIMDILKPPPARWLEELKGGIGIVADDLVAGFYSNLVLQVVLFFLRITMA